jgi:hypothetical protein
VASASQTLHAGLRDIYTKSLERQQPHQRVVSFELIGDPED